MFNGDDFKTNPFTALFSSEFEAKQYRLSHGGSDVTVFLGPELASAAEISHLDDNAYRNIKNVNHIIENALLITIDKEPGRDRPARCILLNDLKDSLDGQHWLDEGSVEQAVMERIMMEEPADHVIDTDSSPETRKQNDEVDEKDVVRYLAISFCRLKSAQKKEANLGCRSAYETCQRVILQCGKLAFQNPSIFCHCDPGGTFIELLLSNNLRFDTNLLMEFFELVATEISNNPEDCSVLDAFRPALDTIKQQLKEFKLGDPVVPYIDLVIFFTRKVFLATALLEYNTVAPELSDKGSAYETTLFGVMLSINCLVSSADPTFQYFNQPSQMTLAQVEREESVIYSSLEMLNEKNYDLMFALLKLGGSVRDGLLIWIGKCLHANRGRAKLSARDMVPLMFKSLFASDGFCLGLCSVLLRLSSPFSDPLSPKLLNIEPTYCTAAKDASRRSDRNIHMIGADESTLIPSAENESLALRDNYNFMTECFFMTHYCFKLGFRVVLDEFLELNQKLGQMQRMYQDVIAQDTGVSNVAQGLKQDMERATSVFLNLKAALTHPSLLINAFSFLTATATYLTHVATTDDGDVNQFVPIKFPLRSSPNAKLACLPEYLAENLQEFMLFIHRFKDGVFGEKSELLEHLLTFILVFMGSSQFMRNPHLRAKMAEALGTLLPNQTVQQNSFQPAQFYRDQLFRTHPLIQHLSETVISAFVSIEVTGQAHFEDKFKYRQPMYQALEYMWSVDIHCKAIKELASYAEEHIEDIEAPLFLRFINLLINDAIYLLDEALSYMSQIKEKQEAKKNGAWNDLPPQQRQEMENGFRHLTMLAQFHNIMGRRTIESLEMVTQHVKTIFVNSVIVDRIAAMLNYFLLHLVGPKKKHLRVDNFEEFQFKPKVLVSNICKIYINLGDYDNFCMAVSQDGRSYSHGLFEQAEAVLCKIHDPLDRISCLNAIGIKIQAMASRQAQDEELLADVPEDYVDPIMGSLMRDPVLLPTSGKIVDRQTIARHILSDQTDPFNRMPLSMNMVKPAVELKQEIEAWIADAKLKQSKQVSE